MAICVLDLWGAGGRLFGAIAIGPVDVVVGDWFLGLIGRSRFGEGLVRGDVLPVQGSGLALGEELGPSLLVLLRSVGRGAFRSSVGRSPALGEVFQRYRELAKGVDVLQVLFHIGAVEGNGRRLQLDQQAFLVAETGQNGGVVGLLQASNLGS